MGADQHVDGGRVSALEREVEALQRRLAIAEKNYAEAQRRTFELSQLIAAERSRSAPLRSLLAEVVRFVVPTTDVYRLDPENIWRRAQEAADG